MLSHSKIQNTKPGAKPVRLFDGRGLYLEIGPKGTRWWRFKYRFAGKEKRISLGVYPDISLKQARERHEEARKLVAVGVDPSEARKLAKIENTESTKITFEIIAREWFDKRASHLERSYAEKIIRRLESDLFPWLGSHPIRDIKAPETIGRIAADRIPRRGGDCSSRPSVLRQHISLRDRNGACRPGYLV